MLLDLKQNVKIKQELSYFLSMGSEGENTRIWHNE